MIFSDHAWSGSYYELSIEVSPSADDQRLRAALEALWAHPGLARIAPPAGHDDGGEVHTREAELFDRRYGELAVDGAPVGCVVFVIREQGRGADWIDVCVPAAMRRGIPRARLDAALCGLADAVWDEVQFQLALVGEERSGLLSAAEFFRQPERATFYVRQGGVLVDPQLLERLSVRVVRDVLPSGLWWIPSPAPDAMRENGVNEP
jgi:hypothetical protein